MGKLFSLMNAIVHGNASIERVDKMYVLRTPGDVTDVPHN